MYNICLVYNITHIRLLSCTLSLLLNYVHSVCLLSTTKLKHIDMSLKIHSLTWNYVNFNADVILLVFYLEVPQNLELSCPLFWAVLMSLLKFSWQKSILRPDTDRLWWVLELGNSLVSVRSVSDLGLPWLIQSIVCSTNAPYIFMDLGGGKMGTGDVLERAQSHGLPDHLTSYTDGKRWDIHCNINIQNDYCQEPFPHH